MTTSPSAALRLWPQIRNTLLFFGGLLGAAYETLGEGAERPTLLLLFAAMMGLPAFLPSGDEPK